MKVIKVIFSDKQEFFAIEGTIAKFNKFNIIMSLDHSLNNHYNLFVEKFTKKDAIELKDKAEHTKTKAVAEILKGLDAQLFTKKYSKSKLTNLWNAEIKRLEVQKAEQKKNEVIKA